jgi:RNA recognition motif-containing protein
MSTRIYVGNLPWSVTAEALQTLFSPYGIVDTVNLMTDRETGRLRGYGFIEMASGAREAIAALNQHELDGRALTVNLAKPRKERTPRSPRW